MRAPARVFAGGRARSGRRVAAGEERSGERHSFLQAMAAARESLLQDSASAPNIEPRAGRAVLADLKNLVIVKLGDSAPHESRNTNILSGECDGR